MFLFFQDLSIASSSDVSPFKAQPQSQLLRDEDATAALSAIVAMENAMAEAKSIDLEEAGASSRKRRRAQVDYVALNEELKKAGKLPAFFFKRTTPAYGAG